MSLHDVAGDLSRLLGIELVPGAKDVLGEEKRRWHRSVNCFRHPMGSCYRLPNYKGGVTVNRGIILNRANLKF